MSKVNSLPMFHVEQRLDARGQGSAKSTAKIHTENMRASGLPVFHVELPLISTDPSFTSAPAAQHLRCCIPL
jgi:hypothetical protein